jgi:glycine cleavage system aminomethyltransferase T
VADRLAALGASFVERDGMQAAAHFGDVDAEVAAVRGAAGLMDASHVMVFQGSVDDALYPLDERLAGNVANLRFGRVLHTLLADDAGHVVADAYVACDEEDLLVLLEACVPRAEVARLLAPAPLKDVTDDTAVFCVDGPKAWGPLRDLFGRDVLGMPYLSVEDHPLDGIPVRLLRGGKTAEFGYWMVLPAAEAGRAWDRLREAGAKHGLAPYGLDALDLLKLDGRFFNVNREGRVVSDPLPLGLQWMFDFGKERFGGRDAVMARRAAGVPTKVVGLALEAGLRGLVVGARVTLDGADVGEMVACGWSSGLQREMGLAHLDRAVAWAGLDLVVVGADGPLPARSLSMPPFVPQSLKVRLDEV